MKSVIRFAIIVTLISSLLVAVFPSTAQSDQNGEAPLPPSVVLIEQAYRSGRIDYDTAIEYKVLSIFNPPGLPAEYQSTTPAKCATPILVEAERNWQILRPETKDRLSFYPVARLSRGLPLLRPTLSGPELTYSTTHFQIHYTKVGLDAAYPLDANTNGIPDYIEDMGVELEIVWTTELSTMGWLQPPSDASGDEGDPDFDVYVEDMPYYGYTYPEDFADQGSALGDNENSPGVTEINAVYGYIALENDYFLFPNTRLENVRVTAAHEFNHAIQFGYDYYEEIWLMEATATWMEDEVYDAINDNHQYLPDYFDYPDVAMSSQDPGTHWYGDWIFPRYISEHHGSQSTIRSIWENSVNYSVFDTEVYHSFDAIQDALSSVGTSLPAVFNNFTVANYVMSTSPTNAPYCYEEATLYPSVYIEGNIDFTGSTVDYTPPDGVGNYAADYITINSTIDQVQITVSGASSGITYAARVVGMQSGVPTVFNIPMSGSPNSGSVTLVTASYDAVILIVMNKTPNSEELTKSGYSVQVIESTSPIVTSVTPNSANPGQTLDVTIAGTNFTDATDVSFGAGITVNSFIVNSDIEITANITVAPGAIPGTRDVSVTTAEGTGTLTDGFTVIDITPPDTPVVTDDGDWTNSNSQLHATWTASDPESGIAEYQYGIGTTAGGIDVVPWTSTGTNTEVTKTGLSLIEGQTYYFTVKARNGAGLWSDPGNSDGIAIDITLPGDPTDVTSTSHTPSVWSTDNMVVVTWTDATDDASGLDGYSILWDTNSDTIPDPTKNIEQEVETATSLALADGNSHYFHIRSVDNVGNWQSTVHLGPFYIDTTPPAAVTDLATSNPTRTSMDLSWTAPGDDTSGTATYDIRYSTSDITDTNWGLATQCTGEPTPSAAGSAETFTVTGLSNLTTYYFALKVADKVSLWSDLSNVTSGKTQNSPPVLSNGGVSPETGDMTTDFTYSVTYTDVDDDPPASPTVSIDGDPPQDMTAQDPGDTVYTDGKDYEYTTSGLDKGSHTYQFAATDGFDAATEGTDIHYGPGVENTPPVLSGGEVAPPSGYVTTDFTYSVTYTDDDNDPPASPTVSIDGSDPIDMTAQDPGDTVYTDGKVYEYTTSGLAKDIPHTLRFAASDGIAAATEGTVIHIGPTVGNSPPFVASVGITPDPAYTDTDLTATPSGWDDPDNDAEDYQWQWQKLNGSWQDIPGANTNTLDSSNFVKDDQIKVICTPYDGSDTGTPVEDEITISNTPPVANTGPDQMALIDTLVTLDGSGSSDADGDPLTYLWEQKGGPAVILSDETAVKPTFTPTVAGTYTFSLVVNDGTDDSSADTTVATIKASNIAPVLSDGTVSPLSGYVTTDFIYSVTYTDDDNDPPASPTVSIDGGAPQDMTVRAGEDSNYTNGEIYEYIATGTELGLGSHNFRFAASDGIAAATGDTVIHSGPTVSSPSLGGGGGGGGRDTTSPTISNISASNITKISADISWKTDERSDSQIEFRSSPSKLSPLDTKMVVKHLVHLTDLTPATTYHFKTMSRDDAGNLAVSEESSFTTLGTPATFAVGTLTIHPTEVYIRESVSISVVVDNTGEAKGTYEVTLKIDGAMVATKEIILAGGASQTVSFTVVEDVAGTYTVDINGLTGTFVVGAGAPVAFSISSLTISPAEVNIGEDITISALVTNTGDATGTYEATLKIDGAVVATKSVTLAGGASEEVTFTTSKDVAGTYTVDLNGLPGTFVVKAGLNWWLIGGIIGGIIIVVGLGVYFYRRRRA